MVNHPPHYTGHPSGIEVIQITRNCSFDVGNAIKYIMRHNHKGSARQDLEKAVWYLNDHKRNFIRASSSAIGPTAKDYLERVIHAEILERTLPGHLTLALLSIKDEDYEGAVSLVEAYLSSLDES